MAPLQPQAPQPDATGPAGGRKDIVHLSAAHPVSMGEYWFEMVSLDHFWIRRRLEVLRKIARPLLDSACSFCEVGCGNGMLQRQLEIERGLKVDGFDLCLGALQQNQSQNSALYYYNVFDRRPELKEKYDTLFLFDVLEHIDEDLSFLNACLHYVKPGGHVIVNVPARMELFSKYDDYAGHVRRYDIPVLKRLAAAGGLQVRQCTYWGLPLYPVLVLRKFLIKRFKESTAFKQGFSPPNKFSNDLLKIISRFEIIPQRLLGTSIMAVFQKPK